MLKDCTQYKIKRILFTGKVCQIESHIKPETKGLKRFMKHDRTLVT